MSKYKSKAPWFSPRRFFLMIKSVNKMPFRLTSFAPVEITPLYYMNEKLQAKESFVIRSFVIRSI
ncbi:MAG: hypothetical protein A3F72_06750 [Bacteroidetes bacterium RIFCSPLOWO2_12_FULL_35_15]|nr:MAG: hypothetical protein A3F72_06750 [Bacteroidetes bacterium RIFCSPLOWO2_12_FULL_35_15]